jgi:hypothetical protein
VLNKGTDFVWKSYSTRPETVEWHRASHEISLANIRAIEFSAAAVSMPQETFQHLAELAAEAWIKAAHRWKEASGESISFEPAIPQVAPLLAPGRVLVANAA